MRVLIDGDIVVYRTGYTTNDKDEGIAIYRAKETLENILLETGASDYEVWLSDSTENNYRTKLYPAYKANRTQPKPVHFNALKEYMVLQWEARIAHLQEADDALGIAQDKSCLGLGGGKTIIASIDKDLLQVPGNHYNFVRKEFRDVTYTEGLRQFYTQVLQGDATDNIKGCIKIGPVKANQALLGLATEGEMFDKVAGLYLAQFKEHKPEMQDQEILDYLLMTGRILRIKQDEDEPLWHFPSIKAD